MSKEAKEAAKEARVHRPPRLTEYRVLVNHHDDNANDIANDSDPRGELVTCSG
jgi:hypothetical protein